MLIQLLLQKAVHSLCKKLLQIDITTSIIIVKYNPNKTFLIVKLSENELKYLQFFVKKNFIGSLKTNIPYFSNVEFFTIITKDKQPHNMLYRVVLLLLSFYLCQRSVL